MSRSQQPGPGTTRRRPHGALIVAAILVGLLVAAEFVTITLETSPRPALTRAALRSVLPNDAASTSALTWTNAARASTGGPLDLTDRRPLLVAACQDGGSIAIELSDTTSVTLDCTDRATAGPIVLDDRDADGVEVMRSTGNPRYIVELLATSG